MKKICKNCKYYNDDNQYGKVKSYGECDCSKFIYDYDYEHCKEKDVLIYYDYESYNAGFKVGEEFGCIHFERKEKNENN